MKSIEPITITKKELADALRLSTRTIDNLVRRGEIPSIKLGSRRLFEIEEVRKTLREKHGVSVINAPA